MAGAELIVSEDKARRFPIEGAAFGAFAALQLWLIFNHSPWFDEAHALLIARAPFADLLANLKYEGHPALWYLWLGSVDRLLGGSAWSLPTAQAMVALPMLALIWFRSPFSAPVKTLLSSSYYLLFEYGVISRSYGLGALLILAAVAYRRSLLGWVFLALAANTSAHTALGAAVLGAVFFFERRSWAGALLLGLGGLAAVLTVYPVAPDLHPTAAVPGNPILVPLWAYQSLSEALVPVVPQWPYVWPNPLSGRIGLFVGLFGIPILGFLAIRDRLLYAAFGLIWFALICVALKAYGLSARHVGILFLALVAALWIRQDKGLAPNRWAIGWLVVVAACSAPFVFTTQPFTPARDLGAWVNAHHLENETFGAWPGIQGALLTSQTGRPTLNLQKGCVNTFVRWDYPHGDFTGAEQKIAAARPRYLISDKRLRIGRLLAHFEKGGGWSQALWLYELSGGAEGVSAGSPTPTCR